VVREREEALRKVQDLEAQVRELKEQVSLLRLGRGSIQAERGEGTGDLGREEEEDEEEECVECESEEDV
jgi:hypothetical protein